MYIPDAVEAMIALGRNADAEPLIEELEHNGDRPGRSWMVPVAGRCRSMWLAARGDVAAANRIAHDAMIEHDRLPMPFERARTQLWLGQLQRRQRQKDAARATFREALEAFAAMGTPLWADRARAELARVNVAPPRDLTLTSSRTASRRARGLWHDQPRHRCGIVHQPENRRSQPSARLPKAWHPHTSRTGPAHRYRQRPLALAQDTRIQLLRRRLLGQRAASSARTQLVTCTAFSAPTLHGNCDYDSAEGLAAATDRDQRLQP